MLKMTEVANADIVKKYIAPGPYYTSYPVLGEWSYKIRETDYRKALDDMTPHADSDANGLYLHFPYCPKQCYFCICNVTITNDRKKISHFLKVMLKEIDMLFGYYAQKGTPLSIKDIHLGGGTPSYLTEKELVLLVDKLKQWIDIDSLREFAIEFDPRSATPEKFKLCHELGFNRLSMGIQDFRQEVQESVNRVHSFEMVQSLLSPKVRGYFNGFNIDLLYGLPFQTRESFQETLKQVKKISPDRITLLKYAHVPEANQHMKILDKYPMANDEEKAWMFFDAVDFFRENGWDHIGIDHFAKPSDSLAKSNRENNLRRGFIGFVSGGYDRLFGIGPSSTMKFDNAYFQNICNLQKYVEKIEIGAFPILSGHLMSNDDLIRRDLIDKILCSNYVNKNEFSKKYGIDFDDYFQRESVILNQFEDEEMLENTDEKIKLTELGKTLFKRHICKTFDQFLTNKDYKIHGTGNKKHL